MGCEYQIDFWGMSAPVDQYEIKSYPPTPIEGKNLAYTTAERRAYGDSLIWWSIPPEWFFTVHETP